VEIGTNWVDVVKINYHAGDVIVCFAEQRTGLFHRPLSQILESNLGATVYILSGLYSQSTSRSHWLSQIIVWMGSFAILAGFFWLQVRISQLSQGPAQTVLFILSAAVEIWLIWVWNSLFS
jgi:FtsH-binding integral membrane protein